jgi:hypothetical protein
MARAEPPSLIVAALIHRRRIGLSSAPARIAVAKFIAMMIAKTGIHDP